MAKLQKPAIHPAINDHLVNAMPLQNAEQDVHGIRGLEDIAGSMVANLY